jgi:hypothetical protein
MPHTQFTVEQANRTLPLVRRIVEDIVVGYRRWCVRIDEFEVASVNSRPDARDSRAEVLEGEALALAAEIAGYEAELRAIGARCTDHRVGLVDFPGVIEGRPVDLCWRLGEPAVLYWHEIGAPAQANRHRAVRHPIPSRAA